MQKHTLPEYLLWMEYLDELEVNPTSTDFYLMQVAQEVARKFAKHPNEIKLEHFKLKMSRGKKSTSETKKPVSKVNREIQATLSQAAWMASTGCPLPKAVKDERN